MPDPFQIPPAAAGRTTVVPMPGPGHRPSKNEVEAIRAAVEASRRAKEKLRRQR